MFDDVWSRPRMRRAAGVFVLVVVGALFWVFRSGVMWGNPDIAVEDAVRGRFTMKHTLATMVTATVGWLFKTVGIQDPGPNAVAATSVLAGLLYIWGAFSLGSALFTSSIVKARVIAWVLTTAGLMQEYFGVLEVYPLSNTAQIWVLVWMARLARPAAEGGCDSPTPILVTTSLCTATFVATVFLWPAVLFAILRERARGVVPPLRRVGIPVLAAILPIAAVIGVLHLFAVTKWGYGWPIMFKTFGGNDDSAWVPLTRSDQDTSHFTLFSWEHASARFNAACLAMPAWIPVCIAAMVCWKRKPLDTVAQRSLPVLGLAALSALSFGILVHPDLGPILDWMQTTAGMFAPLVFLMTWTLARTTDQTAARLGTLWVVVSVLHTFPWVVTNSTFAGVR
ncbi:MAG: hypothetical protein ACKVS6_12400 [Planctomycetota bacterium]